MLQVFNEKALLWLVRTWLSPSSVWALWIVQLTTSCSFFAWHWVSQEQTQEDPLFRFLGLFLCVAFIALRFCYPNPSYLHLLEFQSVSPHLREPAIVSSGSSSPAQCSRMCLQLESKGNNWPHLICFLCLRDHKYALPVVQGPKTFCFI